MNRPWGGLGQLVPSLRWGTDARRLGVVVTANLLLAGAAVLREALFAWRLGAEAAADSLFLGWTPGDVLGNLLLYTGFSLVLVPPLARLTGQGRVKVDEYLPACMAWALMAGALCTLGIVASSSWWVSRAGVQLSSQWAGQARLFAVIAAPTALLGACSGTLTGALHAGRRFTSAAFAPVVSALVVVGVLWIWGGDNLPLLAVSMPLGVGLGALVQLGELRDLGRWRWPRREQLLTVARLVGAPGAAVLVRLGVLQLVPVVERMMAGALGTGAVSCLNYGYKAAQFPLWVFGAAVAVVVYPALASSAGNRRLLRERISHGIELSVLVTWPWTVWLWVLRRPILGLLLQRGLFLPEHTARVAYLLATYAWAAPLRAAADVLLRGCYAGGAHWAAAAAAAAGVAVVAATDVALLPSLGLTALGLGAVAGTVVELWALGRVGRKVWEFEGWWRLLVRCPPLRWGVEAGIIFYAGASITGLWEATEFGCRELGVLAAVSGLGFFWYGLRALKDAAGPARPAGE